jgi:hypothetical protein
MTWIFFSPAEVRTTSKESFSSSAAASPPPAPGGGDGDGSGGGDLEGLLELLDELAQLDERELLEGVDELVGGQLRHGGSSWGAHAPRGVVTFVGRGRAEVRLVAGQSSVVVGLVGPGSATASAPSATSAGRSSSPRRTVSGLGRSSSRRTSASSGGSRPPRSGSSGSAGRRLAAVALGRRGGRRGASTPPRRRGPAQRACFSIGACSSRAVLASAPYIRPASLASSSSRLSRSASLMRLGLVEHGAVEVAAADDELRVVLGELLAAPWPDRPGPPRRTPARSGR